MTKPEWDLRALEADRGVGEPSGSERREGVRLLFQSDGGGCDRCAGVRLAQAQMGSRSMLSLARDPDVGNDGERQSVGWVMVWYEDTAEMLEMEPTDRCRDEASMRADAGDATVDLGRSSVRWRHGDEGHRKGERGCRWEEQGCFGGLYLSPASAAEGVWVVA